MISGFVSVLVELMAHTPSQLWGLGMSSRYQESCTPPSPALGEGLSLPSLVCEDSGYSVACGPVSLMSLPEFGVAHSFIYRFMCVCTYHSARIHVQKSGDVCGSHLSLSATCVQVEHGLPVFVASRFTC